MDNNKFLLQLAEELRVPSAYDKVYNDECMYSFDSPYSDNGLYISLHTYEGVGVKYLRHHSEKTGSILYLHSKWIQVRRKEVQADEISTVHKVST